MSSSGETSAPESFATNTLHVILPPGMGPLAARQTLSVFGEIMFMEAVPSPLLPAVLVAYFDVRSAEKAQLALGFDCCRPAPQSGNRLVKLPGSVNLGSEDIQNISLLKTDPQDSSFYLVEFFDIRFAQRAQERFAWKVVHKATPSIATPWPQTEAALPPGLDLPPGLEFLSLTPPEPKPAYVIPSYPRSSRQSLTPKVQRSEVEVLLKGLPKALCTDVFLDAMLEQAGLEGAISERKITGKTGEARVKFLNQQAAKRCVQHFNGRHWETSGSAVVATILTVPDAKPLRAKGFGCLSEMDLAFSPEFSLLSKSLKVRTVSEDTTVASSTCGASVDVAPTFLGVFGSEDFFEDDDEEVLERYEKCEERPMVVVGKD